MVGAALAAGTVSMAAVPSSSDEQAVAVSRTPIAATVAALSATRWWRVREEAVVMVAIVKIATGPVVGLEINCLPAGSSRGGTTGRRTSSVRMSHRYVETVSDDTLGRRFKQWFWRPPRAHGEVIAGRTVSALELFYDLVYVAVIGQAAHHLAEHVTARGVAEFAILFALIWIAWVNGSVYLELHGREDGRTRNIVFIQMGMLVLLAVFTADAADGSGRSFALVYATFLGFAAWLWYSVRRQDRRGALGVPGSGRALPDRHGRGRRGRPR